MKAEPKTAQAQEKGGGGGAGKRRHVIHRPQQKGIAAFLNSRAMFWGDLRNASTMPIPVSFPAHYQLFVLFLLLVIALVGFLHPGHLEGDGVTTVEIDSCFVHFTCDTSSKVFTDSPFALSVSNKNNVSKVDGKQTKHCAVALCIENLATRTDALNIILGSSVLNLKSLGKTESVAAGGAALDLKFALTIASKPSSGILASKVYLGPYAHYPDLAVNITHGIIVADRLNATAASLITGFGSVHLGVDFARTPPYTMTGTVRDNNYCVSPRVTSFSVGDCIVTANVTTAPNVTTTSSTCPFYAGSAATRAPGGSSSSSSAAATDHSLAFNVQATSLYISAADEVNETRIAGAGIATDPSLDFAVLAALAGTDVWQAQQALTFYVQVIDVITPTIGSVFALSSRKIILELAPDRLAFYTGFVMRPHYRRLPAVLSHYGCPAGNAINRSFATSASVGLSSKDLVTQVPEQTLTGVLDTGDFTDNDLVALLNLYFPPASQYVVSQQIFNAAGDTNAVVAFDAQGQTDSPTWVDKVFGEPTETLSRDEDGFVSRGAISFSAVTIILLTVNYAAALMVIITFNGLIIFYRKEVLNSIFLVSRRSLQRQMVGDNTQCPYHYFLSFNTMVSWVAFRVSMYTVWPAPSVREFLGGYFRSTDRDDEAMGGGIAVSQLTGLFERWMVLRYVAAPEANDEEFNDAVEAAGGRRVVVDKYVIRGLRKRTSTAPGAIFELTLHSLENYYIITRDQDDEILLDDLFFRAVIEDPSMQKQVLIKALREWNFVVVKVPINFITGLQPIEYSPSGLLTDNYSASLIESFENACASWPSYARVLRATWGQPTSDSAARMQMLAYLLRRLFNSLILIATAFLPFIAFLLISLYADYERLRYTSMTTRNSLLEVHATMTFWLGQDQSIRTWFAVWCLQIFLVLFVIEPFLVLATFRSIGPYGAKAVWRTVLKYVRFAVTTLISLLYWAMVNALVFYISVVLVWWVLGAIIAPNYMLVYASAAVAFVFSISSTHASLTSMRAEAVRRLETRVLEEMLKLIRRTPAAQALQTVQDRLGMPKGTGTAITAGMLMDATSDDPVRIEAGVQALAIALGVPDTVVLLILGIISRKPDAITAGVMRALDAMKAPEKLYPLVAQLVAVAVDTPANARDITEAFLILIPEEVRVHVKRHDEVLVSFVGMMLKRTVDPAVVQDFIIATVIAELSRLSGVPAATFRQMYLAGRKTAEGDTLGALAIVSDLAESTLLPLVPAEPLEYRLLGTTGIEALRMAADRPHNLNQAAVTLVQHIPGLRNNTIFEVVAPLILPGVATEVDAGFAIDMVSFIIKLIRQRHATAREQWNTVKQLFALAGGEAHGQVELLDPKQSTKSVLQEALAIYKSELREYLGRETKLQTCRIGHPMTLFTSTEETWWCNMCQMGSHEDFPTVVPMVCFQCSWGACPYCLKDLDLHLKAKQCEFFHPFRKRDPASWTCSICREVQTGKTEGPARKCYECDFEVCGKCAQTHGEGRHKLNKPCVMEVTAYYGDECKCIVCGGGCTYQTEGEYDAGYYIAECETLGCLNAVCLDCWEDGAYVEKQVLLFCDSGHPLRPRDPVHAPCISCKKPLDQPADYEATTRCRSCLDDMCAECMKTYKGPTAKDVVMCRRGHQMNKITWGFECATCGVDIEDGEPDGSGKIEDTGWACMQCSEAQCQTCAKKNSGGGQPVKKKSGKSKDPTCKLGHALMDVRRAWCCDICNADQPGPSIPSKGCPICEFDLCENCVKTYKPPPVDPKTFCPKGHEMEDANSYYPFRCMICHKYNEHDDTPPPTPRTQSVDRICWSCYDGQNDEQKGICQKCCAKWKAPRRMCENGHYMGTLCREGFQCTVCSRKCECDHLSCPLCDVHLCEDCGTKWTIFDRPKGGKQLTVKEPEPDAFSLNNLMRSVASHKAMNVKPDTDYFRSATKRVKQIAEQAKCVLAPWLAHQWLCVTSMLMLDDKVPDSPADYDAIEHLTGVPSSTLRLFSDAIRFVMTFIRGLCPHLGLAHTALCKALHEADALGPAVHGKIHGEIDKVEKRVDAEIADAKARVEAEINGIRQQGRSKASELDEKLWDYVAKALPDSISLDQLSEGVAIGSELLAFAADAFGLKHLHTIAAATKDGLPPNPCHLVLDLVEKAVRQASEKVKEHDKTKEITTLVTTQREKHMAAVNQVLEEVRQVRIESDLKKAAASALNSAPTTARSRHESTTVAPVAQNGGQQEHEPEFQGDNSPPWEEESEEYYEDDEEDHNNDDDGEPHDDDETAQPKQGHDEEGEEGEEGEDEDEDEDEDEEEDEGGEGEDDEESGGNGEEEDATEEDHEEGEDDEEAHDNGGHDDGGDGEEHHGESPEPQEEGMGDVGPSEVEEMTSANQPGAVPEAEEERHADSNQQSGRARLTSGSGRSSAWEDGARTGPEETALAIPDVTSDAGEKPPAKKDGGEGSGIASLHSKAEDVMEDIVDAAHDAAVTIHEGAARLKEWDTTRAAALEALAVHGAAETLSEKGVMQEEQRHAVRRVAFAMLDARLITTKSLLAMDNVERPTNDINEALSVLVDTYMDRAGAATSVAPIAKVFATEVAAVEGLIDPSSIVGNIPEASAILTFVLECVSGHRSGKEIVHESSRSGVLADVLKRIGVNNIAAALRIIKWFLGESNDAGVLVGNVVPQSDHRGSGAGSGDFANDNANLVLRPLRSAALLREGTGATAREADAVRAKLTVQHARDQHVTLNEVIDNSRVPRPVASGDAKVDNLAAFAALLNKPVKRVDMGGAIDAAKISPSQILSAISESLKYFAHLLEARKYLNRELHESFEREQEEKQARKNKANAEEGEGDGGSRPPSASARPMTAAIKQAAQKKKSTASIGATRCLEYISICEALCPSLVAIARTHRLPQRGVKSQQFVQPILNVILTLASRMVVLHHKKTNKREHEELGHHAEILKDFQFEVPGGLGFANDNDDEEEECYDEDCDDDEYEYEEDEDNKNVPEWSATDWPYGKDLNHFLEAFMKQNGFTLTTKGDEAADCCEFQDEETYDSHSVQTPMLQRLFGVMYGVLDWYPAQMPRPFWALITALVRGPRTPLTSLEALCSLFPLKTRPLALELLQLQVGDVNGSLLAVADFTKAKVATLERVRRCLFPDEFSAPRLYCLRAIAQAKVVQLMPFAFSNDERILILAMVSTSSSQQASIAVQEAARRAGIPIADRLPPRLLMAKLPTVTTAVEQSLPRLLNFITTQPHVKKVLQNYEGLLLAGLHLFRGDFVGAGRKLERYAQGRVDRAAVRISVILMRLVVNDGAVRDAAAIAAAIIEIIEALPELDVVCGAAASGASDLADDIKSSIPGAASLDLSVVRTVLQDVLPFIVDNFLRPIANGENPKVPDLVSAIPGTSLPPPPDLRTLKGHTQTRLDPRTVTRFVFAVMPLLTTYTIRAAQELGQDDAASMAAQLSKQMEKYLPIVKKVVTLVLEVSEGTMTLAAGVCSVLELLAEVAELVEDTPQELKDLIFAANDFFAEHHQLLLVSGPKFFLELFSALVSGGHPALLQALPPDVRAKVTCVVQLANGDLASLPDVLGHIGVMLPPQQEQQLESAVSALARMQEVSKRAQSVSINPNDIAEVVAQQIFSELDTDGDNEISFVEFQAALARLHMELSDSEARTWFAEMDVDSRGVLLRDDFLRAVYTIRQRFLDEILSRLHLTKSLIYLALGWFAFFLALILAFVVLGAYGFSDGAVFTACITGMMPAFAMVTTLLKDPGELQRLLNKADDIAEQFFSRIGGKAGVK